MSGQEQSLTFDLADSVYDSGLIEFISGKPRLKETTKNRTYSEDLSGDTGITYDSDKVEFDSGQAQQKDQTPDNSVLATNYDSDINLLWRNDGGSLTGNQNNAGNAATIVSNKLDCTGNTDKGVYYGVDNTTVGSLKFRYTPNYTTSPPGNVNIVMFWNGTNNNDRLGLTHSPSGTSTIRVYLYDDTGSSIYLATTIGGLWSFTNGQEYEFLLTWDSSGTIRVFIDGTIHGTLSPAAWDRGTDSTNLHIGATSAVYNAAEASFNDIILYDVVTETSNYTAGYTITLYKYAESLIELMGNAHIGPGSFLSGVSFTTSETGSPKYVIDIDGTSYYWNGSEWATSLETYATASTASEINSNFSTLTAINGSAAVIVLIVFPDSNTAQSKVDNISHVLNGTAYSEANPTIEFNETFDNEGLCTFVESATKLATDEIKWIIKKESIWYYFNGVNFVESGGTYSQSNTSSEIVASVSAFLTTGGTSKLKAFFHSDDGTTTSILNSLTVTYDFFGSTPSVVPKCIVFGYEVDGEGNPKTDLTITALLTKPRATCTNLTGINRETVTVTTNSQGYWEMELVQTVMLDAQWIFIYSDGTERHSYTRTVPQKTSANFVTLEA